MKSINAIKSTISSRWVSVQNMREPRLLLINTYLSTQNIMQDTPIHKQRDASYIDTSQPLFNTLASPFVRRATPCSQISPRLPMLPLPDHKVLETVCSNCSIGDTPLTKHDYALLVSRVYQSGDLANSNIAKILRSRADYFYKERKLYHLMVKEFGFSLEERVFKNTANTALKTGGTLMFDQEGQPFDVGFVGLLEFLVKFGAALEVLPERFLAQTKISQVEEQNDINIEKENSQLQNQTSLEDALQENAPYGHSNQEEISLIARPGEQGIIQGFTETYFQKGLNELVEGSQIGLETFGLTPSDICKGHRRGFNQELEAHEQIDFNRPVPSPCLAKPNYFQPVKPVGLSSLFSFLDSFQPTSKPKEMKTPLSKSVVTPVSSHYSFQNILRQQKVTDLQRKKEHPSMINDNNPFSGFKRVGESLISAQSSLRNTPLQNPRFDQYQYHTEQKPKVSRTLLFNDQQMPKNTFESPATAFCAYQQSAKESASTILSNEQKLKTLSSEQYFTPLGKRGSQQLFESDKSKRISKLGSLTTPSHLVNKRQKLEQDSSFKVTKFEDSADSEGEEVGDSNFAENDDPNNSASRKKRGLKILSVKVQELVSQRQKTTYKDVANELIDQLKQNSEMQVLTGLKEASSYYDDDDSSDEDSPPKKAKGSQSNKKMSLQKWEKNVRRRVYDALNVLYAAGVLKKEGKQVFCDNTAALLQNEQSEVSQEKRQAQEAYRKRLLEGGKLQASLDKLKQQVQMQKARVEEKREVLADQVKHYLSYSQLISRNQMFERHHKINKERIISLPFILVATTDSPDNEVEIAFGEGKSQLNIAMKKPLRCYGDADTLMQLGMYRATPNFYHSQMPDSREVLKLLSEDHKRDIFVQSRADIQNQRTVY